jgi:ribosomal protein L7Ae-like RNA K-turn-binding protein
MDNILSFLGIIKKAGFLETGEENTAQALRTGKCRAILLAGDASPNAVRRAEGFAERGGGTPLLRLPHTKEEISAATGRAGCSMAAVTDVGFAGAVAERLRELDPERFTEAAEILAAKRDRAARRLKESAAREKNKMAGKLRRNKA